MNILIVGGPSNFTNSLLVKCHKEGHRVSVLTGDRYTGKKDYSKYFELYRFPYEAQCIGEIIGSVNPDVTVFMGAFDSNFNWKNDEAASVHYQTSLANVLLNYAMLQRGRFIYLSSHEVFEDYDGVETITEETPAAVRSVRGLALTNAEEYIENYRKNLNADVVTLRLDHLYGIPKKRSDIYGLPEQMCMDALEDQRITYAPKATLSVLYENDAVEAIYRVIAADGHMHALYQISQEKPVTEQELAESVQDYFGFGVAVEPNPHKDARRIVLSKKRFESEYGGLYFRKTEDILGSIADRMKKKPHVYLEDEDAAVPVTEKVRDGIGWLLKTMVPFIENLIVFIIAFMLYNRAVGSKYFDRLDIYLLYVLLFAILFGQQQATLSAFLSVLGYCFRQTYERSGFDLLLDANTYVWVAELFIVGLSVGYLKDRIQSKKFELEEDNNSLRVQLHDIAEINATNVRVKDVLETQIVNQSDSVGKIYAITSSLDQYSAEEVLFYAAETVGKLMKSKDVAIYLVSNSDYARLFSATSKKARSMGNSIKYPQLGEVYEAIVDNKVYVNKRMDDRYPLMARGIYENDELEILVFVWGLSWENMTLSQANQLIIVSALIQNAVLRADRYMEAMEQQRYIAGTRMLEPDAFKRLADAFLKAESRGLTECTLLEAHADGCDQKTLAQNIGRGLRNSDYYGELGDGGIYILLSNTNHDDAKYVIDRFAAGGVTTNIVEDVRL